MTAEKKADPKASRNEENINCGSNANTEADHLVRFLDAVKNASERVRVDVKTYRGKTYIDVRIWYVTADGEYRPSSKGVMIKPTLAPELLRGIALAAQSFDPKGSA